MKQFGTIFKFELLGLIRTKVFIVTTTIFCLISIVGISIPSIFGEVSSQSVTDSIVEQFESEATFAVYDENNIISEDNETLKLYFPKATFQEVGSKEEVKKLIRDDKADSGFVINKDFSFIYVVNDSSMTDITSATFSEALSQIQRDLAFEKAGLDSNQVMDIYYNSKSEGTTEILGSDGANNIIYTFGLIFTIYMVIIIYGQVIATTVASEKGNRTMELLVTSASTNSLIFGKVLAGAAAATIQVGLFIGSAILMYSLNGAAWNGMLDMIFNIPASVMGAFIAFGLLGFLFYAFIFGALGALVSKSEDVNSSSTPMTVIFLIVYFVVYIGVMDPSSPIFAVASFVPFSSPMAMFARMAMIDVPIIEVIISLVILIISTILVGLGAAKIYRRGTLMYGNQVKFIHALKWLKKNK